MRATPPTGLPVLRPLSSFMHASANTPAGAASASIALFPAATGLPLFRAGSTPTLPVSRPARRSLTFRPACSLNRLSRSFCQSASIHVVTSMNRPDCYQPETIVAGRDSHPLERGAFHGARGSRASVYFYTNLVSTLMTGSPGPGTQAKTKRPVFRFGNHFRTTRTHRGRLVVRWDWSSCFTNYKAGQALEGVRREAVGRCP